MEIVKRAIRIFALALLLLAPVITPLQAEVFLSGSGANRQKPVETNDVSDATSSNDWRILVPYEALFAEKIEINGFKTEIEAGIISGFSLSQLYALLSSQLTGNQFFNNVGEFMVSARSGKEATLQQRTLFTPVSDGKCAYFTMELPEKLPPPVSTGRIQTPGDAILTRTFALPARGVTLEQFSSPSPHQADLLTESANWAISQGFRPMSGEARYAEHPQGEILFNPASNEIIWMNFLPDRRGRNSGNIVRRALR